VLKSIKWEIVTLLDLTRSWLFQVSVKCFVLKSKFDLVWNRIVILWLKWLGSKICVAFEFCSIMSILIILFLYILLFNILIVVFWNYYIYERNFPLNEILYNFDSQILKARLKVSRGYLVKPFRKYELCIRWKLQSFGKVLLYQAFKHSNFCLKSYNLLYACFESFCFRNKNISLHSIWRIRNKHSLRFLNM
jgi:hypothetical protein